MVMINVHYFVVLLIFITISNIALQVQVCEASSSLFLQGELGQLDIDVATPNLDTGIGVGGEEDQAQQELEALESAATATLHTILDRYLGALGNEDVRLVVDGNTPLQSIINNINNNNNNNLVGLEEDDQGNYHLRFHQYVDGMRIQGAAMVMHVRGSGAVQGTQEQPQQGTVFALNGEFCASSDIFTEMKLSCQDAMNIALSQSGIQDGQWSSPCIEAAVRGQNHLGTTNTNTCYKAYQQSLLYGGGYNKEVKLFASGENGDLVASHPLTYHARTVETRNCMGTTTNCKTVSNSSDPINTGQYAIDYAHNNTILTYDFYWERYGRDSVDNAGYKLISNVNYYNADCPNAYWWNGMMYYCPEDSEFFALSKALDAVAHELTHGVTEKTSELIYVSESGALNEAISDIFGAAVERIKAGKSISDTWLIAEDLFKDGVTFIRDMSNPTRDRSSTDFYPDRRIGYCNCSDDDYGYVHRNSGIVNLAFVLMTQGGTHPRNKTTIKVPPIDHGFDNSIRKAAKIFYNAQTKCLTPDSDFAAARACTEMFAGQNLKSVQMAWSAVGVERRVVPTSAPTKMPTPKPTSAPTTTPTNKPTPTPTPVRTHKVVVKYDQNPAEFSWLIREKGGRGKVVVRYPTGSVTVPGERLRLGLTLTPGTSYKLTATDSTGDGLRGGRVSVLQDDGNGTLTKVASLRGKYASRTVYFNYTV